MNTKSGIFTHGGATSENTSFGVNVHVWMDDLRFNILFNRVSVISEGWEVDNERLCVMKLLLRVEKISP